MKKKMVKESKHYHLGKADAFEGRVGCMAERGSDEHRDYFRGFRDGLNEAYGCDESIYEDNLSQAAAADPNTASVMVQAPISSTPMPPPRSPAPGSTTPGSSTTAPSTTVPTALEETMFLEGDDDEDLDQLIKNAIDDELDLTKKSRQTNFEDDDELEEGGNKFLGARAEAQARGDDEFTVDGEKFPVKEDEYDFMEIMETAIRKDQLMNSWNKKLSALLAEQTVADGTSLAEGMTVTTTSGSEHSPDSININATDEDAHELMRILKHSGLKLGLGDSDEHDAYAASADHDDDDSAVYVPDDDYASEEESCGDDDDAMKQIGHRAHSSMMSMQDKPEVSVMRLQPRDAVDFDDIIGAFGGRMSLGEQQELLQLLKLSGKDIMEAGEHPKGKGMSTKPTEHAEEPEVVSAKEAIKVVKAPKAPKEKEHVAEGMMDMPDGKGMSKNVKDKAVKVPKPTDQSAIMSTLKPGSKVKNSGLESLQNSHDPGPASSDNKASVGDSPNKPKTPKPSEKHDFENASLSESLASDLYKLYTISENAAATNNVTGYKQVDAMAMPRGMGMSIQADDTPQKVVEPTDHEDVMKALDQGEAKIVKFPKLERLLKDHMPDTEDPKIMDKQSETETRKLHVAPDAEDAGAYADSESSKKLDEGHDEMCSECGGYMEEGHQCEAHDGNDDEHREQLEEWANDQGRDGTEEAERMSVDYMVNLKSGGMNGMKRDQTTLPHTEVKIRAGDDLGEWLRLSGLR